MDEAQFLEQAERLLQAVEKHCDGLNETTDLDLDNQRTGGMLSIVWGAPLAQTWVINLQKPLYEIWFATPQAGLHYRWDGQTWRDNKTGSVFWDDFSRQFSQVTGQSWTFTETGAVPAL
jgi:CyaY protein